MAKSFTKKRLRFTFTLSNSSLFEGTNSNTLVIEGLRAIVNVKSAGFPIAPTAQAQVFGVRESDMNALTMLAWKPLGLQRNTMKIEANNGDGWVAVFSGQIIESGPDYDGAPDACLRVQAVSLYYERLAPAPPSSYTGAVQVATIVEDFALAMGYVFENNDVQAVLQSPYIPNTLAEQLRTVCDQAGVDLYIDGDVIAITPKGQPRQGQQVELNAQSGLLGYPKIDKVGITLQCLYNPGLRFGGPVNVTSDVPKANGSWYIYALEHYLSVENPGGPWFSLLGCSEFGRTVVRS